MTGRNLNPRPFVDCIEEHKPPPHTGHQQIGLVAGLSSERDRTGLVTSYAYDALGRQETATRLGITTKTTYDADGRVKTIVRIGTDATEMTQETNFYDLAGRLTEKRDALSGTGSVFL